MSMDEQSYWERRERENLKRENLKDEEVMQEMERIMRSAVEESEKEIDRLYAKYADDNNLTRAEALQVVSETDVESYQRTAARYVQEKNFSDRANRELKRYNVTMRINREKLLKAQINAHLVAMAVDQIGVLGEYLNNSFYREIERQAGILGQATRVTTSAVRAIVGASFQGATWSTRIWNNMKQLRGKLFRTITNAMTRGVHPYKDIPTFRRAFGANTGQIKRLLITETARVQMEGQKLSYEANDVKEYQYIAVIDNRTTKTCRGLNKEVFDVVDMKPGVNASPMHPNCRSSTIPYVGNWRESFFAEREGRYTF